MTVERYPQVSPGRRLIRRRDHGAPKLLVLIHGLAGAIGGEYWGHLPDLCAQDPDLKEFDFLVWGYKTNRRPNPPPLELALGRLPDCSDCGRLLSSELATTEYRDLILYCHSFGGLVAAEYVTLAEPKTLARTKTIGLCGVPVVPPWPAYVGLGLTLGMNRQVRLLASRRKLDAMFVRLAGKCNDTNIALTYFQGYEDALVVSSRVQRLTSDLRDLRGTHSSMLKIYSRSDPNYATLKNWLLESRNT